MSAVQCIDSRERKLSCGRGVFIGKGTMFQACIDLNYVAQPAAIDMVVCMDYRCSVSSVSVCYITWAECVFIEI